MGKGKSTSQIHILKMIKVISAYHDLNGVGQYISLIVIYCIRVNTRDI